MLLLLLVVLVVFSLGWGTWGYSRYQTSAPWVGGWSPFGLLLVVLLILYLTGNLGTLRLPR